MASLYEISAFLDELLELDRYAADDSNNGLQFQGVPEVTKAVFAVDGCEAVFNMAADINADLIFVHHGIGGGHQCRSHICASRHLLGTWHPPVPGCDGTPYHDSCRQRYVALCGTSAVGCP